MCEVPAEAAEVVEVLLPVVEGASGQQEGDGGHGRHQGGAEAPPLVPGQDPVAPADEHVAVGDDSHGDQPVEEGCEEAIGCGDAAQRRGDGALEYPELGRVKHSKRLEDADGHVQEDEQVNHGRLTLALEDPEDGEVDQEDGDGGG